MNGTGAIELDGIDSAKSYRGPNMLVLLGSIFAAVFAGFIAADELVLIISLKCSRHGLAGANFPAAPR